MRFTGSLATRIWLGVALVAVATLIVVGGGLFVALRDLHVNALQAHLADLAQPILAEVRRAALGDASAEAFLSDLRSGDDPDLAVHLVTGNGRILGGVGDAPPPNVIAAVPTRRAVFYQDDYRDADGTHWLYAAVGLGQGAAGARSLVVAAPDRSTGLALRDLAQTLPAVVVVTVLVGGIVAAVLARSVSRPLRRLAAATADVPRASGSALPLEGPSEVRELTSRFNGMLDELRAARERERELLASLRHDLRTPATVITGFATALSDGTATGPDADRAVKAIAEEAGRLASLVAQLGDVERLDPDGGGFRHEPIDPVMLLTTAAARFASRAEARNVRLQLADVGGGPEPPELVVADRVAVDRIVGNLIENALAAVPAGGNVWLDVRPASLRGQAGADREAVALVVIDDGPGFPPGSLPHVFDRFYRGDPARSGGGSGLGLSIVRDLARAHGGEAHAENLVPRGARVSVLLPLVPDGAAPGTPN